MCASMRAGSSYRWCRSPRRSARATACRRETACRSPVRRRPACPSDGATCMWNPGAAFASQMPSADAAVARRCWSKGNPRRPRRGRSPHRAPCHPRLSGWITSVTSVGGAAGRPVRGRAQVHDAARTRMDSAVVLRARASSACGRVPAASAPSVADARRGSWFTISTSCATVCAVADDGGVRSPGRRDQLAVHDQQAVVVAPRGMSRRSPSARCRATLRNRRHLRGSPVSWIEMPPVVAAVQVS